jgi:hypothetical protein
VSHLILEPPAGTEGPPDAGRPPVDVRRGARRP